MEIAWNYLKCYDKDPLAPYLNALVDTVQSITLNQSLGYNISRTPVGTTLRINQAASAATSPLPFTVTTAPISGDTSNVAVKVRPGTLNSLFASNLFDSFTVSNTELAYVTLDVSTDGQNITSYDISAGTDAPDGQSAVANALPSTFDITLAVIQSGTPYQAQYGSFQAIGAQSFTVDKDPPAAPGQLTYTPYFVWNISTI